MKRIICALLCLALLLAAIPAVYAESGIEMPDIETLDFPSITVSGKVTVIAVDMDNEKERSFLAGATRIPPEMMQNSFALQLVMQKIEAKVEATQQQAEGWLTDECGLDPDTFRYKELEIVPETFIMLLNGEPYPYEGKEDYTDLLCLSSSDSLEIYAEGVIRILGGLHADPCYGLDDVDGEDWFYDDVAYAVEKGLMRGVSESSFAPGEEMSRAMLVTVLYRQTGEPAAAAPADFSDVPAGAWYADAVAWAAENGIVNGYDDGLFHPDDVLTREQFATILYRYARAMNLLDETETYYTLDEYYIDVDQVSDWAAEAMLWANNYGLIMGVSEDMLAPRDGATRAQAAAILHRFEYFTGDVGTILPYLFF